MLPKSKRLAKKEVTRVLKTGRKFSSKYFLVTATSRDVSHIGFAAVVSKKVAKNATDRNKLRRRVYNAIRPLLPRINKPFSAVISVKKEIVPIKFGEVSKDLAEIFISMGVI